MSPSDPNLQDSQRLLGHGATPCVALHQDRVRAFARALLRDEHAAEDVVQDTWVRALERRPGDLHSGAGWFVQVARRFALNRLRSDARRTSRERRVARPEAVPSSAEIAARVELQRVLLDALEALPDPWRATLRDHDLGELSLAEIARRDGLAPETVRSRLLRARQMLREALAQRRFHAADGHEQHWSAALLVLAGSGPPRVPVAALATPSLFGVGVSLLAMKSLVASLVAVMVIVLVWGVWSDDRAGTPHAGDESESAALTDSVRTPPSLERAALEHGSVTNPDRRSVEVAVPSTRTPPTTIVLQGSVRHSDGAALTTPIDVLVALHEGPTVASEALARTTARTDDAGCFVVEFPAPGVDVYVTARVRSRDLFSWQHDPVLLPVGAVPDTLQLIVGPLDVTLTGLVSTSDGVPIAAAEVRSAHLVTETDEAGRYSLRVNSATCERATASAPGYGARTQMLAKLAAGSEHTLDFALQPGVAVRGTVHDDDSAPIIGATLRLSSDDGNEAVTATSDSKGVYALLDVARTPDAQLNLHVHAEGHVLHWAKLTLPAEGDLHHDVRLVRGARIRGQVIDERGQPLSGADVWVGLARHSGDCLRAASDAAGRFELLGVGPGRLQLGALHQGFAEQVETFEVTSGVRGLPSVIVRLGRGRTVTGTVVDELGHPIAGVSIHARRKHSEGVLGLSAADGTFTLEQLPDFELTLSTSADDWQDVEVTVPAGSSVPLELHLERAGRLHGRVVDAVTGAPLRVFTVRLVAPELRANEGAAMGYRMHWEQEGVAFDAADGRWSTAGESLTPGVLGVEVCATGYEPQIVTRALVVSGNDAEELVHALHPIRR